MAITYNQVTDVSNVITFVSGVAGANQVSVPDDCVAVLLQAETASIRFRPDGTSPTAAVGMRLIYGDAPIKIDGKGGALGLKFLQESAGAKLNIAFLVS